MTRVAGKRRVVLITTIAVAALAVSVAAWILLRPASADVMKRFEERVTQRFPGATVTMLAADFARVVQPSGLIQDAALAATDRACHGNPFGCSNAVDALVDALGSGVTLVEHPRRAALRAVIVGESAPGYRYGLVTEPLIGALEIRYALVAGDTMSFVTLTTANKLGLTPATLREDAVRQMDADPASALRTLPGEPGIFVARGPLDGPSQLLSAQRMKKLAEDIGMAQLYCAIPRRGLLLVAKADAPGLAALRTTIAHAAQPDVRPAYEGVLRYDSAAPEVAALSALN